MALVLVLLPFVPACGSSSKSPAPVAAPGDAAFRQIASEILEYTYKRDPSNATYLGIHKYDDLIQDYSAAAVTADVEAIKSVRAKLNAVDAGALSLDAQLDLEKINRTLDGVLLRDEVIRSWAKDPDLYSSGITNAAYVMISRTFAPPEQRLKSLIARLKLMPNALAEARKNLDNPPRVYTEIAIEQLDGNRDFFAKDVPAAFAEVREPTLVA